MAQWIRFIRSTTTDGLLSEIRIIMVSVLIWALSDGSPLSLLQQKGPNIRICGENLARLLGEICKGNYNKFDDDRKRSDPSLEEVDGLINFNKFKMEEQRPVWYSSLNSVLKRVYPVKGVHDECCETSCSLSTLLSYCGL